MNQEEKDKKFMVLAIELSKLAIEHGNEPFGAVLVKNDTVVYTNENQIHTKSDPTFHGETGLIRQFCSETNINDLSDYTMYSSCEPCFMCSGAMVWSKLGRLVYAASNIELENILGLTGSKCSQIVFDHSHYKQTVTAGVLKEDSLNVLQSYFGKEKH